MEDLAASVDRIATETSFSGVVRVDDASGTILERAWGEADRAHGIPNTVETRFGIASGSKGFTALVVVRLIEEGTLGWTTTARSVLGDDLPLVDDGVTVEHLLAHRSGIGDYLDEEAGLDVNDHVLTVPPHRLVETEDYLEVLDGHRQAFPPGERFSYCNGGYVVLALIAERASGVPFHDLVRTLVCEPATMDRSEFLRSDELPGDAALGYLFGERLRTNVLHLPVRGSGDGGMYSTLADVHAFWEALFEGRIVRPSNVREMVRPRSTSASGRARYGLGFWLRRSGDAVALEGSDAGVSFRSVHDPGSGFTHTVISNTTEGAWPIARSLDELTDRAERG